MENQNVILEVRNLSTSFLSGRKEIRIVKNVSLKVSRGKALAVVGESGCGKTVLMNSILRFLGKNAVVTADKISYYRRNAGGEIIEERIDRFEKNNGPEMRALRGPQISMVFQDPMSSLNPVYKVGDQVIEGLREHYRMPKKEARRKALELFRRLGIPDPESRLNGYPHEFSGGMKQRVVIAAAMICNPELMICDEPTTALDVTIQAQILALLKKINREKGTAILFISHDLNVVRRLCSRVAVIHHGKIVESGLAEEIFRAPQDPYTRRLIAAIPRRDRRIQPRVWKGGDPA